MNTDNVKTQVPCPACALCDWCKGTREYECLRCIIPHQMVCPACDLCGLCRGTHMVATSVREEWLNLRPTEPPPEAA